MVVYVLAIDPLANKRLIADGLTASFPVLARWHNRRENEPLETPDIRTGLGAIPPHCRSIKTNGRRLFVDGDGRGPWARRWRDLQVLYADDLGGASTLSQFQMDLVATCASLRCELEKLEGKLSLGEDINLDVFGRLAGHYRRICEALGIERRKRVLPSVEDYVASLTDEAAT